MKHKLVKVGTLIGVLLFWGTTSLASNSEETLEILAATVNKTFPKRYTHLWQQAGAEASLVQRVQYLLKDYLHPGAAHCDNPFVSRLLCLSWNHSHVNNRRLIAVIGSHTTSVPGLLDLARKNIFHLKPPDKPSSLYSRLQYSFLQYLANAHDEQVNQPQLWELGIFLFPCLISPDFYPHLTQLRVKIAPAKNRVLAHFLGDFITNQHSFREFLRNLHLPINRYHSLFDECAICLDELFTNAYRLPVKMLRCQHYFHQNCVDDWLRKTKQCPICNQEP